MPRTSEYLQHCLDEPRGTEIPDKVLSGARHPEARAFLDAYLDQRMTLLHPRMELSSPDGGDTVVGLNVLLDGQTRVDPRHDRCPASERCSVA